MLPALFVASRKSPYFQLDDMFYVECIPAAHLKDYLYYGTVSTYIPTGSSLMTNTSMSATKLSGQCEVWKNAMNAMTQWAVNNSIKNYWTYPDEFMNHNNCRNFDLTLRNNDNNQHLALHMKMIKSNAPAIGPWCYAYDSVKVKQIKGRTKILAAKDTITKPNYNAKLIDTIAVNAFSKYEWGPSTYYDSRPSNLLLSAEFERNRYSIFIAMIVIGIAVLICSISFVVVRNYLKTKEKEMKEVEIQGGIAGEVQSTAMSGVPSLLNASEKLKQEVGVVV
ncbi:unnamed protein product [Litomosoides sigmodontis]|uniref:Kringle-like domain-containing protein n=1 Tax=Litomosoides sigmodontis TaxID=42156 RepID=A0A3P6SV78_LITSI|nr:unnamed protein product [Litomosoides sigmodontis]